jgi:hypothetical protein
VDLSAIATLIGGLGIGSTVAGYLTSGQSRREVRGAVLQRLADVETARWVGPPDAIDYPTFRSACHALETAALIARVPRDAVQHYLRYARAARMSSQSNWDRYAETEVGGFIVGELSEVVSDAAELLTVGLVASSATGAACEAPRIEAEERPRKARR